MNEYILLNGPRNLFRPHFVHPRPAEELEQKKFAFYNETILRMVSDEVAEFFSAAKLTPGKMLVFYQKAGYTNQTVHIDSDGSKFTYSMNWVYGGGLSIFKWYRPVVEKNASSLNSNDALQINYVSFAPDEVRLLNSSTDTGPIIINTQVPHKGESLEVFDRWSYSIRFYENFDSMDALREYLKDFVIDAR